jgi:hypothetical protein
MDELVAAGEAVELLPEFAHGPAFYEGLWWGVPQGPGELELGYALASPDQQIQLTRQHLMLEESAATVAQITVQRRLEEVARAGDDVRGRPDAADGDWSQDRR